jgi:glycosyltransferase involved in cell wall biosynthesis
LLENPEYARELARKGLEYSREHFNWDRITDAIVGVYRGAIASRKAVRQVPSRAVPQYTEG